jgi:hypothetical protein
MPSHLDVLIERLKKFDEVSLLELLDITSEEIIERFMDVIEKRREYLFGEVEELTEEWMDEDEIIEDEYEDGYQIEERDE